jgi:lipoprotein-anchoring transpeptidase ErfK/SrfK
MLNRIVIAAAVWIGATVSVAAREIVTFSEPVQAGTIVIRTQERRLYYVRGDGTAIRYRVAVGRPGKQWFGRANINGKHVEPAWSPPADIRRDNPKLPDVIPSGSPRNPMGARALTLDLDQYAIHGTNNPKSIGTYASYGCIRMLNADIIDLFDRVHVGTDVIVTR